MTQFSQTAITLHQLLTECGASRTAEQVRYMSDGRDCGSLAETFGADVSALKVGARNEADDTRACYAWWLVMLRAEIVGELRDDAAGYTFHDALEG